MDEFQKVSEVIDDLVTLNLALVDLRLVLDRVCESLIDVIGALAHNISEEEQTDE